MNTQSLRNNTFLFQKINLAKHKNNEEFFLYRQDLWYISK